MAQQQYINYLDLKAYLSIDDTDTTQDKFLQIIIPQAMAFIDRYTKRTFGWGDTGDSALIDYSDTNNILLKSAVTTGSSNPYTLTLTFVAPGPWQVGSSINLSGFTPSGYNGDYTIATASADGATFTVDITSNPGAVTTLGTVQSNVTNYRTVIQESYDSLIGHIFYLRNCDIRSVDAVWLGLRNINQPTLLDKTQYVWRDDGRIILGGAYFNTYDSSVYTGDSNANFWGAVASGYQTVTVNYKYGYVGVPPEIAMACLDICQTMYIMRQSKGIYRERIGDYDIMYQRSILQELEKRPDILGILDIWKRRRV